MQRNSTGMNKKAIAILGAIFILIIGTLGFLIYSKYSGGNSQSDVVINDPNQGQDQQTDTPSTGSQDATGGTQDQTSQTNQNLSENGFTRLTEGPVISPVLFFNGRGVTYFDDTGKLFQADFVESGNILTLTRVRQVLLPYKAGINRILWPKLGNQFMAEIQSFAKKSWSLYDGNLGVFADLPPQVTSVDWMPTGDKIVYVWQEDGKATLNISDPDTTNWQEISEMWELNNNIYVSPDGKSVLYFRGSTENTDQNSINVTNLDGTLWEGLVKEGFNYGVLWSPDGQKFLFGKKSPSSNEFTLWVYDMATGEAQNLGVTSRVEKAVWDKTGREVYVAGSVSGGLGSLNPEKIYRIDTSTLSKREYDPGSISIDSTDLFLSSSGNRLFFKNNEDGGLYYLDLNQVITP